jgi:hypothetical protein
MPSREAQPLESAGKASHAHTVTGPCSKKPETRRGAARRRPHSLHLTPSSSGATRSGAFDRSFFDGTMGAFKRTIGESLNGGPPVGQERSRT